jgi:hypothetical protein
VVAVSAPAGAHQEERIEPVSRVAEAATGLRRRISADFWGRETVAPSLMAVIAIVAALTLPAAVIIVLSFGSPLPDSPGPVLGIANPIASADAESTPGSSTPSGSPPRETGSPGSSGSATLPPTGGTGPGRLETTAQRLSVWKDKFGQVRAQVIVMARNAGGTPLVVATSAASWSVSDGAGDVTARGRFTHAFPGVVAPGGVVFFIDGVSAAFAEPAELAKLDVVMANEPMDEDGTLVPLETNDLSWTIADGGGLEVSGNVSNTSTGTVTDATVGIVVKDARGQVVAGVYSVDLGDLAAGESRPFTTAYPGTPPIDPAIVAGAEAAASGRR